MAKEQAEEKMNIYQKLAKIRKNMEVFKKNKDGYGYKYVSEDEILSKLSVWLDKTRLLLIPEIKPGTAIARMQDLDQTKVDKKSGMVYQELKNEVLVEAEVTFTWLNIDNPEEKLTIQWFLTGQQADASQAFGSGLTYCMRYFLLKFFNIATVEDDPDNWRSKQKNAEKEEDLLIAKEVTQMIDEVAKKYVADSKDVEAAKERLLKITKKYVKSGNYLKITEPALASKLLDEVKALAGKTKEEK